MQALQIFLDPLKRSDAHGTWNQSTFQREIRILEWWKVITDVPISDPTFFLQSPLVAVSDGTVLPQVSNPYAPSPGNGAQVIDVWPQKVDDSPLVWEVQITYASFLPTGSPTTNDTWNVSISSEGIPRQETVYHTRDFKFAVHNSAGKPFDPSIEKTYYDQRISLRFNSRLIDPLLLEICRGKVNQKAFDISLTGFGISFSEHFGIESVLFDGSWSAQTGGGHAYISYTYNLLYRLPVLILPGPSSGQTGPQFAGPAPACQVPSTITALADDPGYESGWKRMVLDKGYAACHGSATDTIKNNMGQDGISLAEPVLLNGQGQPIAAGQGPVFIAFDIEEVADFTGLFNGLHH